MAVTINGSGPIAGVTSINSTVSDTELGYLDGVTSALQTQINTAGGLVKITDQSFSAASAVNVNNCFSSTYDNYRITLRLSAVSGNEIGVYCRLGTSSDATTNYKSQRILGYSNVAPSALLVATDSFYLGVADDTYPPFHSAFDVFGPNLAGPSGYLGFGVGANAADDQPLFVLGGKQTDNTQFTRITIYPNTGTITGVIRVYGYRN